MYFCDKGEVMLGRGGEDKKKSGISVRGFSVSGHIQLQLNWRMKKRGLGGLSTFLKRFPMKDESFSQEH